MQRPQLYIIGLAAAIMLAVGCETTPASNREVTVVYPEEVKYAEIDENTPAKTEKKDLVPEIEETGPIEKKTDKIASLPVENDKKKLERKKEEVPPAIVKKEQKNLPKPVKKKQQTLVVKEEVKEAVIKPMKKEKLFHLRVISLPFHNYYRKEASAIADFIKQKENLKYAIARKSRNRSTEFWVVDVGGFSSLKGQEAKKFQKRIQNTKYQGVHQFGDAFYVRY